MPSFVYVGLILLAVAGGGAWYYKATQAQIMELTSYNATLTANVEKMEEVNQQNVEALNNLQASYEKSQKDYEQLQNNFNQIRNQNNQLRDRLGKHDLGALAAAKPALVERVVNNASTKVMRCFELESGAFLNDNERSAANAQAFNSECPWLYDDYLARGMLDIQPSGTASEDSN